MKKQLLLVMCLTVIAFVLSSCGTKNNSATENNDTTNFTSIEIETNETTSNKTPLEVLVDAGLSQQLIDAYLLCNSTYTPEEYIQVIRTLNNAKLSEDQILSYFQHFLETYRPEEYITAIEAMVNAGLSDDQINRYSVFRDIKLETYINFHKTFEDVEDILSRFYLFSEYYSFEEYCNLISNLRTVTGEQSLAVLCAISNEAFFVQKTISTYNEEETYFAIMNRNAEFTVAWSLDWRYYDIADSIYKELCIVPSGYSTYNGAVVLCDVINMEGRKLTTIESNGDCFELGNGYILCAGPAVAGGATIVHTSGENHKVDGFGIRITGPNVIEEDAWIGNLSEGLWGTIVDRGNRGIYARYYNTNGEMVIDLRENLTNFAVTKLGEFTDGQAKIEFTGANHKNYYAYIDKTGAFVDEPIEITE